MTRHKSSRLETEVGSVDRISELPDFVMHSILSLLDRDDAVRTSVLSKRWNRVWETFPDLFFNQYTYTNVPPHVTELTPEMTRRVGDFLDMVKRSLSRSVRCDVGGIRFSLKTAVVGHPELCSKLSECFELALGSRATAIAVCNTVVSVATLPEITLAMNPLQCRSLRELSLSGIRVSEKQIDDIFLGCPNITTLSLMKIIGLAKLDINKLDKLKFSLVSSVEHLSVDAPKLRRLGFLGNVDMRPTLNLTSCPGLREFNLVGIRITDELFGSLFTLCPLLECLMVYHCKVPRKVIISAKYLATLVLEACKEVGAVEIDAPALQSFKYESEALAHLLLKTIPSELEIVHTLTSLRPYSTSCFVNLRNFLAMSTPIDCLTLKLNPCQVAFDLEELIQVVVPRAFQLRHLKLELQYKSVHFDEQALIDGLLWSCHPKTISLFSDTTHHSCAMVLSESLLEMEKNPSCCGSSRVKCWRHDLKSARAADCSEGSDARVPVMRFELEWDNDSSW